MKTINKVLVTIPMSIIILFVFYSVFVGFPPELQDYIYNNYMLGYYIIMISLLVTFTASLLGLVLYIIFGIWEKKD